MNKDKEFIYLWFVRELNKDNTKVNEQYNHFSRNNKISVSIPKLNDKVNLNNYYTEILYQKLFNDKPITDKDIDYILKYNSYKKILDLLILLNEINPKYQFIKQDKLELLIGLLQAKGLTVGSIVSQASDPLNNRELMEEIILKGFPFKSTEFYSKKDKKPKYEEVSYKDKFAIYKDLVMQICKKYIHIYESGNLELLNHYKEFNGAYIISREEHEEIYKWMSKATEKDIDAIADALANGKSISNNEIMQIIKGTLNFSVEHIGSYNNSLFDSKTSLANYDVRIYINSGSSKEHYLFLKEYILMCIDYGIGYDMKGVWASFDKDGSVLYSRVDELPKRIIILEKIQKAHPEWTINFGSPISLTSTYGSGYYGICHAGSSIPKNTKKRVMQPYSNYCTELVNATLYYTFLDKIKGYIKNNQLLEKIKEVTSNPIDENDYRRVRLLDYLIKEINDELEKNGTSINKIIYEEMKNPSKRSLYVDRFQKIIRYLDDKLQNRDIRLHGKICCDEYMAGFIRDEQKKKNNEVSIQLESNNKENKVK